MVWTALCPKEPGCLTYIPILLESECIEYPGDMMPRESSRCFYNPVTVVGDLGVMLQSNLSMKGHVARTVSRCFRQLRLLKGCIKSLPFEAARAAVAAFVTSQVDRCNSLLVGAPKRLLDCLQSVFFCLQSEKI